jgi:hypothetical protein
MDKKRVVKAWSFITAKIKEKKGMRRKTSVVCEGSGMAGGGERER